jgi:hypothetical protein
METSQVDTYPGKLPSEEMPVADVGTPGVWRKILTLRFIDSVTNKYVPEK